MFSGTDDTNSSVTGPCLLPRLEHLHVGQDRMQRRERARSAPLPTAHLSVHQAGDGCPQPYLQHLEPVHVLLLEQRLQAGGQEHQHRDQVALPGRGCGIANELQEKACGRRREEAELVREGCLCPSLARSWRTRGCGRFYFQKRLC